MNISKPIMCRKCLEYGHEMNYCDGKLICGKCSGEVYERSKCTDEAVKRFHCDQNHEAEVNMCLKHKYQVQALAVQAKSIRLVNTAEFGVD